jgi:YidC/Oxa1 family membrane protein insertase
MQDNNKNLLLAISLSLAVLVGWQYLFGLPSTEEHRKQVEASKQPAANPQAPATGSKDAAVQATPDGTTVIATRDAALASGPRVKIETPKLRGSFPLTGGEIDDIALKDYRETVDPRSPLIDILSPYGTKEAYYADFGWVAAPGAGLSLPNSKTVWTADKVLLTPTQPVTLSWTNDGGLTFRRQLSIDEGYLITVKDSVENASGAPVTLQSYGLIRRHGTPKTQGYYILHEGLIGVAGEQGLQELTYARIDKENYLPGQKGRGKVVANVTGGFAGITDKYWAAVLAPDQKVSYDLSFSGTVAPTPEARSFQADILMAPQTVAPGASIASTTQLFVGAKEVKTIAGYDKSVGIKNFDLLIDWGWFYFITKPMFMLIDLFFKLTGNFGVAILIVTVIVKAIFYPLANKSYVSMAKMKALQPQIQALRERAGDDKVKQQQEMMELYKREKINPLAGCLPVLVQIPVFFSLYKVLFVTIEMRHAPFFGWIRDLSAPDPTSVFNLFGLIPWTPPAVMMIGLWPLIMGVTMFVQMKMNPEPPDPVQRTMFTWMPVIFTYTLSSFPAGLVIYWSWNNLLSVIQQYAILKRQGVKVELWDNLRYAFRTRPEDKVEKAG